MSYIVNPLSYRLTKTKFSKFNWINLSKINYKKLYFEDKILNNFALWINFFFKWISFSISVVDFNIIKFYKFIQINIKFLIRKKKKERKKKFYKKFIKKKIFNFFSLFFKKKLLKNFFILKYFFIFKKKNLYNKNNNKYYLFFLKRKRKKKIRYFILNYFHYKKKKINSLFLKNYFLFNEYSNFLSVNLRPIKKKKFLKYFFFFFKSFLIFFLNNIFYNKKIIINILIQREFFNSSTYLSKFIKMRILQKYRVLHIIGLLFNNLLKQSSIVGINIGVFGRYQKKLRNRKVWKMKGMISPSNINSPISYKNFIILLRYGICGVKFYLLMKVYKNEIF